MTIIEALESKRQLFKEMYINRVNRIFDSLVEKFGVNMAGDGSARGSIYNNVEGRVWRNVVRQCTDIFPIDPTAPKYAVKNGGYRISNEKLDKEATKYAQDCIEQWLAKINHKIGALTDVTVYNYDTCRFDISGQTSVGPVRIQQDMILNCSSKGMLFNQFPARIYVNDKFISEKNFKEIGK
jgi:hypothetical protein